MGGTVTREEYEASYAVLNGLLVAQLKFLGLTAVPCACGAKDCRGWQMVSTAEVRQRAGILFLDENLRGYEERSKC